MCRLTNRPAMLNRVTNFSLSRGPALVTYRSSADTHESIVKKIAQQHGRIVPALY